MNRETITEIKISGMRCVEKVRLNLGSMNVLIGENGTGKSTMVEACELLRKAAYPDFPNQFHGVHAGFSGLGSRRMELGVRVEGEGPPLLYEFALVSEGHHVFVDMELLNEIQVGRGNGCFINRSRSDARYLDARTGKMEEIQALHPASLILSSMGLNQSSGPCQRVLRALQNVEVHLPFGLLPEWVARSRNLRSELRGSMVLEPTSRLSTLGSNLASAYHALKNDQDNANWRETLSYIRLGLGDDFEDLGLNVDPSGGRIAIKVKFSWSPDWVLSDRLSDGIMSYLALVAIFRLDSGRSLLVFDEPDLHLNPQMLMRVVGMLETMSRCHPVIVATHSDRLLDGLSNPADAVVLCELGEKGSTGLRRPDRKLLDRWLERYRGLGEIRASGHESSVMTREEA